MLQAVRKGVASERLLTGARPTPELGVIFEFFVSNGVREESAEDHRLTEERIAAARPSRMCCSILQPIPGTEVHEQLRPRLLVALAEVGLHCGSTTWTWKRPSFTIGQLRQARRRQDSASAQGQGGANGPGGTNVGCRV